MASPALAHIQPLEYLENEIKSLEKHEYFEGQIYAMSGASLVHNQIFSNLFAEISKQLSGKPCNLFGSDLRIHIPKNSLYTYPDLSIVCDPIEMLEDGFDNITNPKVLIEILSKSTREYDRGTKFKLYRDIESLHAYLLVDSLAINLEYYYKTQDNTWHLLEFNNLGASFNIDGLDVKISIKEVYKKVFGE